MAESVRVAVRVRPFNGREKERGAKLIIDMNGSQTLITDPEAPEGVKPKDFSFDFSYWSHSDFSEQEDGVLVGTNSKYATQRKVYSDLGQGVLDNAYKGFNCSLFAYGQTGAGKSYSMVGYGPNKGIVPISCDELFKKIEGDAAAGVATKYQVTFSMLEIYNEQVRDLLRKDNPKGGLAVRQNPKIGAFYVQGLKFVAVGSYKEIEARTEEGTNNRTVACTAMNATSSRAHTVVTIQFDQIEKNDAGEETKKESVINLVDLAGSERAESTGATGDRLKEGANINKSLSSLGNVISALADLSMGKKKVLVPYRDSVLTKLLQNALGGNSKTIMIAALSPADINYDETLGTLRYADRAKKIKTKAVVNENPMDKLIRELKEENDKLKKAMAGGDLSALMASAGDSGGGGKAMTEEEKEAMRKQMEEEIRAQMEENMRNMQSWDSKLEESRTETVEVDINAKKMQTIPHLLNLNEDESLSKVVKLFLEKPEITVGKKDQNPDIPMNGLSIQKEHAVILVNNGEVSVKPGQPGAKTKINGAPLTGERTLMHNDRILFGSNHMYVFSNPTNQTMSEGSPKNVDYDFAQKEIAESKGFATGGMAGLSKDQALAQEQVLELLPMVSEVNAISEELDKKVSFEVILVSGAAQGGDKGTKVVVKMKNLQNGNVWLWDRGKFTNRRYMMQDLYQRFLDGDEEVHKIKQDEDPFWEPPEDSLIGTANVFLQSLSYALDFDDNLTITDFKGTEEGSIVINVTPCDAKGKPLDEDYFVDEPTDLLGKPYHFKVLIRHASINKTRFSHGIFISYTSFGEQEAHKTKSIASLSPEFNDSKVFTIPTITDEHLEWFEHGCLTFNVYGVQHEGVSDPRLAKMTTKELREMDNVARPGISNRQMTFRQKDGGDSAILKAEVLLYKKRNEKMQEKEKRIQELVNTWGAKEGAARDFEAFHRAVKAAAFHERGQMKFKVNLLNSYLKSGAGSAPNSGGAAPAGGAPANAAKGSKACSIQ